MKLRWGWCWLAGLLILVAGMPVLRSGEVIGVDKVIAMLEAQIDETTIMKVAVMEGNITQFDMSTDNIIKLKKASATEKLIAWMIEEATKDQRQIQTNVTMFLNNARNLTGNMTDQDREVFRSSRQKVLAHGQKSIPVLCAMGLKRETASKAKVASLSVIYELLTPEYQLPALTEQLKLHLLSDDADVRYESAHAFAVLATQADLDEAFETILKNHPMYTDGYVMVLAYSRNGNSIPKLSGLMENSDPEVRRVAAFGIGYQHAIQKKAPTQETQNLLAGHLVADQETTEVRISCAKALADMGHYNDAILIKVIQAADKFPQARPHLTMTMQYFTENNFLILDFLVNDALVDTDNPLTVDAANSALRKLTKRNDNTIEQWRNWWRVQRAVLEKMHAAGQSTTPAPEKVDPNAPVPPTPGPTPAPENGATGEGLAPRPLAPEKPAAETVIAPTPRPDQPAQTTVASATPEQQEQVMEHLKAVADLKASTNPKDWGAIASHYQSILVILRPLGDRHSWNAQFKNDLMFTECYKRGLELMGEKKYAEARAAFEECEKIGFNIQFDGVKKRLKELDHLGASK